MPRAPRVWFPGAWYHVIARGNNKGVIFFAPRDYRRYLWCLKEALRRYEARLHAYALMNNHVHLCLETGQRHSIGQFMQWLHTSYAGYINHRYRRVGHLFQGRYKSVLVDQDVYALALSRYIHLNPVRAHLVQDPADYPWSSYRAFLNPRSDRMVTTDWIFGMVSPHPNAQIECYRQFIEAGFTMGSDPMRETVEVSALGSDPTAA